MGKEEQEANWIRHWTESRRAAWKLRSHYGVERQYLAAGCVVKTCVAPLSRVTILMQVQSMRPHKFRAG